MTEEVAIETAIDTAVALKLSSLSAAQAEYTQVLAISVLLAAFSDADVNGYSEGESRAALINAVDCIEKLINLRKAEWVIKFQGG